MSPSATLGSERRGLWQLACLAGITWLLYLAITLSARSLYISESGSHRVLVLLGLFGLACGCYFAAIRIALCSPQTRSLLALIVTAGVLFRATMVLSNPIEEIDLYRYLWDGAVVTRGVSPFRYSPQQVLGASTDAPLPEDLARLVRLRDSSPGMVAILKRIHFPELPTIYPPVSQAVFAACTWLTPQAAPLMVRMVLMKAWFVGCDLLTLAIIIRLLRISDRPVALSIIYAWCPLLIKEIANSGHLDSLAFSLTTLSLYLAAKVLYVPDRLRSVQLTATISAAVLALAVGAKLYPVVLAPLLFASFVRRLGIRRSVGPVFVFAILVAALALPMWPQGGALAPLPALDEAQTFAATADAPPLPPDDVSTEPRDPSQSVRAFLSKWEMNDFLFLLVVENLRPSDELPPEKIAWFTIVPQRWRSALTSFTAYQFGVDQNHAPFFLARAITSLIFMGLAGWFARCATRATTIADWITPAFLTIAWFWLLLPTQNPWYWTWALPLLPFARSRVWWTLSALAFIYYLRFWFVSQFPATPLMGTNYTGPWFFDFVITWLEFCPWFIALFVDSRYASKSS
jgi:hypothetical protein